MRSVESIKSKALLPGSQNTQYVTGVTVNVTGYNPTRNFTFDINNSDISFGHNAIPIYDTRIINAFDNANYGDRFTTSVLLTYNNIQIDNGTEGIINYDNITTYSVPLSYIPLPLIIPNLSLQSITASYGDADIPLLPSSDSAGAYTFLVSPSTVATIVGANSNILHIVGAGTASITVTQLANGIYDTTNITVSLTVNKILPNLVFNNITAIYGDANFELVPFSDSNGAYTFIIDPPAPSVVTIVGGSNLDVVGAGSATLTIRQAETSNYLPQIVSANVTVYSGVSGLLYNDIIATYGNLNITISPSSDSTGAYTFLVDNTNVATIVNGNQLNIVGAGTATLTITQARTTNHVQTTINVPVTINKASTNLSLASITVSNADADFRLLPSSNSNGAYTFLVNNTNVATIVGANSNALHIVGVGTTTLTVTQAANNNYEAQTINVPVTVINALSTTEAILSVTKESGQYIRVRFTTANGRNPSGNIFRFQNSQGSQYKYQSVDSMWGDEGNTPERSFYTAILNFYDGFQLSNVIYQVNIFGNDWYTLYATAYNMPLS